MNNREMTWYFHNGGVADGPHSESAMLSFIQEGHINIHSLIWHPGLDLWQEAGVLQASWWQTPTPKSDTTATLEGNTATHRSTTPNAPTGMPADNKGVGFLKRLFGKRAKP